MKYVAIDNNGFSVAILFDVSIPHDRFLHMHPVSAGFCSPCGCHVWGKSVSLGIGSRPDDDAQIIRESIHRKNP